MAAEAPGNEELGEAERIAVLYAPQSSRTRFHALLLLDAQLARIVLSTREPALAQLKLAWWRDAFADGSTATPLLRELARCWAGETAVLADLVDGWEELAAGVGGFAVGAERLAEARGLALTAAARLSANERCRTAARRWTLVTLAGAAPDEELKTAMLNVANGLPQARLPRALRPLAVLDGLARRTLRHGGRALLGDRLSPLAALRLGIFGR